MLKHKKVIAATLVSAFLLGVSSYLSGRFFISLLREYLQPTMRVPGATILVVEAWLAPHLLKTVKLEFDGGGYDLLVTTASESSNEVVSDMAPNETASYRAAGFLCSLGIDSAKVVQVPAGTGSRHCTFAEAKAFKQWLVSTGRTGAGVNIFTANTHGRKTWIAFRRVLKDAAKVGIISHPVWQGRGGLGPRSRVERIKVLCKHGFGYLYALIWPVS